MPPVNGSEAVAFVSMPLKSIRVVADLAFLHNEQIMNALPNVLTSALTLMCCVILHDALIALEDKKTNQQTISHHLCFPQTRRFQTSS